MRRLLISCGRSVYKNKRGLIPSLFLYINRGSQGSDLGDRGIKEGLSRPDRHATFLFLVHFSIFYFLFPLSYFLFLVNFPLSYFLFLVNSLISPFYLYSSLLLPSKVYAFPPSYLRDRKRLKSRRAKLGEILISSRLAKPNYILIRYLKNGQHIRNFWTTHLSFTDRVDGLQPNQFVYLFSSLRSIRTKNQATVIVSKSLTNPSLLHYQMLLLLLPLYTLSSMLL